MDVWTLCLASRGPKAGAWSEVSETPGFRPERQCDPCRRGRLHSQEPRRLGARSRAGTGSGPARPFARLVSLDPQHQREGVVDRLKLLRVETAA